MSGPASDFLNAYACHRAAEGRSLDEAALRSLPYLRHGPLARQWTVRARTFDVFLRKVVMPVAQKQRRPLRLLDLGAGNGWLSHRICALGHRATAVDVRDDTVDGLGAARLLARDWPDRFICCVASFEDLPLAPASFDIVVFNASLHYAQDLARALAEAIRMALPGSVIAILDSPFYHRDTDGAAMVAEKKAKGLAQFGVTANILLAQNFIEYLTPDGLAAAAPSLSWRQTRVRYPLWYEVRPIQALLKAARAPSRFDLWTADAP